MRPTETNAPQNYSIPTSKSSLSFRPTSESATPSTPILPKPNWEHLITSASLSTKQQSKRSRLIFPNPQLSPDNGGTFQYGEDAVRGSFHACLPAHPLSPIKSLTPLSRLFPKPQLDRASVVSFKSNASSR